MHKQQEIRSINHLHSNTLDKDELTVSSQQLQKFMETYIIDKMSVQCHLGHGTCLLTQNNGQPTNQLHSLLNQLAHEPIINAKQPIPFKQFEIFYEEEDEIAQENIRSDISTSRDGKQEFHKSFEQVKSKQNTECCLFPGFRKKYEKY